MRCPASTLGGGYLRSLSVSTIGVNLIYQIQLATRLSPSTQHNLRAKSLAHRRIPEGRETPFTADSCGRMVTPSEHI